VIPTTEPPADVPECRAGHGPLAKRQGRTGPFWGCSRYPECKETRPIGLAACPKCHEGQIVERIARKSGRPFWPCSSPACDFVLWQKPHRCQHGELCLDADTLTVLRAAADHELPF
jgi:ssDNA-binding Zn-finger/Zn-ribbon topoisomerase 1